jgi:hypothetical protein
VISLRIFGKRPKRDMLSTVSAFSVSIVRAMMGILVCLPFSANAGQVIALPNDQLYELLDQYFMSRSQVIKSDVETQSKRSTSPTNPYWTKAIEKNGYNKNSKAMTFWSADAEWQEYSNYKIRKSRCEEINKELVECQLITVAQRRISFEFRPGVTTDTPNERISLRATRSSGGYKLVAYQFPIGRGWCSLLAISETDCVVPDCIASPSLCGSASNPIVSSVHMPAPEARLGFSYQEFEGDLGFGDFRAGLLISDLHSAHNIFKPSYGSSENLRIGDLIVDLYVATENETSGQVFEAKELVRRLQSIPPHSQLSIVVQPSKPIAGMQYRLYTVERQTDYEYVEKQKAAQVAEAERQRLASWPKNGPSENEVVGLFEKELASRGSILDALTGLFSKRSSTVTDYYNFKVHKVTLSQCSEKANSVISCMVLINVSTAATDPVTRASVAALNITPVRREFQRGPSGWTLLAQK